MRSKPNSHWQNWQPNMARTYNMSSKWKRQTIDNMELYCSSKTAPNSKATEAGKPPAQIGQLVVEGAFVSQSLLPLSDNRRKTLVSPNHSNGISAARQYYLLAIRQLSYFYKEMGETSLIFELMSLIDEQFLKTPYYGARQMALHLNQIGYGVSRKRIGRLMRLMGLSPIIYQKPITSTLHPLGERVCDI